MLKCNLSGGAAGKLLSPACSFRVLLVTLALFTNSVKTSSILQQENSMKARVVIVGGGVSGIGAANKLMRSGIKDVIILEAMDRIGGRVNYIKLGDTLGGVDLGGHWVHGQGGNIMYELAEPLGLVHHSGDFGPNQAFYRSNGQHVDKIPNLYGLMQAIEHAAAKSHAEPFDHIVNDVVEKACKENGIDEQDIAPLQRFMAHLVCTLESCQDLSDVSARGSQEFKESEGDRLIEWKEGGMASILRLLLGTHEKSPWKGLDVESKVKLSSRVSRVDWSSSPGVTVQTESGDSYLADYVIFTPSLNVLKKKHKAIFNPPLPKAKANAIQALGMDVVDKVYLVYNKPWWSRDKVANFNFLQPDNFTSPNQGIGKAMMSLSSENHNPHVLCAWFTGLGAKTMESMTDDEVKTAIMTTVRQYLAKDFPITDPDKIARSKWWNTEDVGGSYSYNSVASEKLDNPRGTLAEPLMDKDGKPVVLFAGEATNKHHFSTVHGALETGFREADRIIELLGKQSN